METHGSTNEPAPYDREEIRVERIAKSFGTHSVLDDLDLSIRHGEIIAIVGASGCGKTVLLHIIVGLLQPDAGHIFVADHERPGTPLLDLTSIDENAMDEIRRHWSIVFQRNALFSGTVYENIALWLREVARMPEEQIEERARTAVLAVGLDPDEVLQKERDELSGGMAKRVAVARGISKDPDLIFYDEPTTGLDPDHASRIHELICSTHERPGLRTQSRTTVVVTHDKDLLYRLRPRIAMLHDGRVFFDGTYEAFMASESPLIRPYFDLMPGLQHRAYELNDDDASRIARWDCRQPGKR